jgi:hypothetical protein
MIIVSAESRNFNAFNLRSISVQNPGSLDAAIGQQSMQLYLVDASGP